MNAYKGAQAPVPEYCYDVPRPKTPEKEAHLASCTKIVDGRCSLYTSVCRKFGSSQNIGCAFSPIEVVVHSVSHKRAGQQKQKHSDRSYRSKNSGRSKFPTRSE